MFGFMAMMAAGAINWAVEFDDLRYAAPRSSAVCVETFDGGEISIDSAFNEKERHFATLLRIRGSNRDGFRTGERLYARGSGNLPYAALVEQANARQVTIVVHVGVAAGLWSDAMGSVFLFRNTANMLSLDYRMLPYSNEMEQVIRQKLTKLMNCATEQQGQD